MNTCSFTYTNYPMNDVCCDDIGCTDSEIKSIACPDPAGSRRSATLPKHVKEVVEEKQRAEVVVEHKKLKELVKSI
ncbi:hypothetical protein AAVH_24915 [Aphelenchoides avenae]|nr:hypothetical protein AAVH_24915 [Aphelenchus avenae]